MCLVVSLNLDVSLLTGRVIGLGLSWGMRRRGQR